MRRSQAQRRQATMAAIIEATITAIDEVGYSAATIQRIADRAGVSTGAVFRHFPSRIDLIAAAADEVGARQIAVFRDLLPQHAAQTEQPSIKLILESTRAIYRAPYGTFWDEINVHARTDQHLRERLEPAISRLRAATDAVTNDVPGLADLPARERKALRNLAIAAFSMEARLAIADDDPLVGDELAELLLRIARDHGMR
ncbi:TetR/AcrR family transcriptional regulator [Lolliginicoccus levis]|uniref:TetR/AcrR family transcriptional regulator n=1 Tax=Lolliginicoccus levis TaxID=2919542 RepID=UPI00241E83B9|nr:TetR/AcrR family transcriptional regulator [Lolliginicoccus levis]